MGVDSLPVILGVDRAVKLACIVMVLPQVMVVALLYSWGQPIYALAVAWCWRSALLDDQASEKPKELAPWYNATGISLYVSGMLISAFALQPIIEGTL